MTSGAGSHATVRDADENPAIVSTISYFSLRLKIIRRRCGDSCACGQTWDRTSITCPKILQGLWLVGLAEVHAHAALHGVGSNSVHIGLRATVPASDKPPQRKIV